MHLSNMLAILNSERLIGTKRPGGGLYAFRLRLCGLPSHITTSPTAHPCQGPKRVLARGHDEARLCCGRELLQSLDHMPAADGLACDTCDQL